MEHAPIYRSTTRRSTASPLTWRGVASFACAGAALTISGVALGYQSLSEASPAETPAPTRGGTVAVPVPITPAPVADRGHPDLFSSLSSALIARVQSAPAAVQQLLYAGPMTPYLFPQPVADPATVSLSIDDLIATPSEEMAADAEPETETALSTDAYAFDPGVDVVAAAPVAFEPQALAYLAVAAEPQAEPEPVIEEAAPAPEPVVMVETPRSAVAVAPAVAVAAVQATPVPAPKKQRPVQNAPVDAAQEDPPAAAEEPVVVVVVVRDKRASDNKRPSPPQPDRSEERAQSEEWANVASVFATAGGSAERHRIAQQPRETGDSEERSSEERSGGGDKGGRRSEKEGKGDKGDKGEKD